MTEYTIHNVIGVIAWEVYSVKNHGYWALQLSKANRSATLSDLRYWSYIFLYAGDLKQTKRAWTIHRENWATTKWIFHDPRQKNKRQASKAVTFRWHASAHVRWHHPAISLCKRPQIPTPYRVKIGFYLLH